MACGPEDLSAVDGPIHEVTSEVSVETGHLPMTVAATFWGTGVLRTYSTSHGNDCQAACFNDPSCTGGTFNPAKRLCWLRTGSGAMGGGIPTDQAFKVGAAEREAFFRSRMTAGATYWGTAERRFITTTSATHCYTACSNDSSCTGGTFNEGKRSCWLRVGNGSIGNGLTTDHGFKTQQGERRAGFNGNIVYGHWRVSGGKSPSSAGNPVFLLDFAGPADIVTIKLSSSVDTYLYLLDANGNVLAEDDHSGGGKNAQLSVALSPGSYRLVAATAATGQTGDFTLSSDKAPLRFPQQLELQPVTRFTWIYDDRGSGASSNIAIWRPDLSQHPGFFSLGDVGMTRYRLAPSASFVVRGEGDLLAKPTDYTLTWNDKGSGGDSDGSLWEPVAPAGYTCLGHVAVRGYSKPSTELIRCVKSAYVLAADPQKLWTDSGSGANRDAGLWQAVPKDHRGLLASTFISRPSHSDTGGISRYWVLNKSATANEELRGGAVDTRTVVSFAPRIWLHADESYFPSSAEFHLANVHEVNGHLVTKQPLGCDSCTDPAFLDGQRPDQTSVPVYAQIIQRPQIGQVAGVTDVLYWSFYPYNNGKRVCIGLYETDLGIGCIGGYSTFGNHVGDWEHLTVRFVDGRPSQLYLSQHADGQTFTFGDKLLSFEGWHPVNYSAKGSHGLYPDAARHIYQTIFNGDFLADDTGAGLAWDTWNHVVPMAWQARGNYIGDLEWMNLQVYWGNPEAGCGNLSGFCVNSGGPGSLMTRRVADPAYMTLE